MDASYVKALGLVERGRFVALLPSVDEWGRPVLVQAASDGPAPRACWDECDDTREFAALAGTVEARTRADLPVATTAQIAGGG